jgi:hypothetical protein
LHPIRSTVAVDITIILNALAFMVVPRGDLFLRGNATAHVAHAARKKTHEIDRGTNRSGVLFHTFPGELPEWKKAKQPGRTEIRRVALLSNGNIDDLRCGSGCWCGGFRRRGRGLGRGWSRRRGRCFRWGGSRSGILIASYQQGRGREGGKDFQSLHLGGSYAGEK